MLVTHTIDQTRRACCALRPLALVPTMGALHEGHLTLIRRAKQIAEHVAVSLFVNPTQFAPHEDFDRYPRRLEDDLAACRAEGVAVAFCPTVEEMYPPGEPQLNVSVPELARDLEAAWRPGFFDGVCRVVAKLFGIFVPETACFGMKDYQQLLIVEALARGLGLPTQIERCPTVREPDGLACSSRNVYLSKMDRQAALSLCGALQEARSRLAGGIGDPNEIEPLMRERMTQSGVNVDYAVVRDPDTLEPLQRIDGAAVLLAAGTVAGVRLIDNHLFEPAQMP